MKEAIKKHWVVIAILSLILINSFWLIFKGMPYQHDIEFHFERMQSLARTIKNGDIIALIHDSLSGYGYALGLFYGNLFFYIPSFLLLLGLPKMLCFKILLILINIGTILIMYFSTNKIVKNKNISLFATTIYSLCEYRLYDVFVRGAIGESLAFMISPLVIYGLYEIIYGNEKKWYYFTIAFVLLLLSHLITTVMMMFFAILIIIINIKKLFKEKNRIKYLIISGIVGLLLGAFFIFPIIEQYLYSNISIFVDGSYYLPSPMSFIDLIIPTHFFSRYLGIALILLIPLRYFIKKKNIKNEYHILLNFSDICLILGCLSLILITSIFPWKHLSNILSFIQFPWRLLLFSSLFISISSSINLFLLYKQNNKNMVKYVSIITIIISLTINLMYSFQYGIRKIHYNDFKPEYGSEYLLSGTDYDLLKREHGMIKSNNSNIKINYQKQGTSVTINYYNNDKNDSYIDVPLLNYLGYRTKENVKIENGHNNLIRVHVPEREGKLNIYYDGTYIQKISYFISIITLFSIIIYLIKTNYN